MKNTGGKTVHQDGEGGERGGEGLKTTKLSLSSIFYFVLVIKSIKILHLFCAENAALFRLNFSVSNIAKFPSQGYYEENQASIDMISTSLQLR